MSVCLFFSIRNVAQETLNQVDDIETALNSSDHVRQEVMSLQGQTDQMIANVNNITETVSKYPPISAAPFLTMVKEARDSVAKREV